jgi:hypothetical protein
LVKGLFQVTRGSFSGPQIRLTGSEGSVLPSDGIPLVDVNGVLGMAWGLRVHGVEGDFGFSLYWRGRTSPRALWLMTLRGVLGRRSLRPTP